MCDSRQLSGGQLCVHSFLLASTAQLCPFYLYLLQREGFCAFCATKYFLPPCLSSNVGCTSQMRQNRLEMLFVNERWDQLLSNAEDVVHCLLQEPIPCHPSQTPSRNRCHRQKGFQQGSPLGSDQVCTPLMFLADTVILYTFSLITLAGYERLNGANTCGRCRSCDSGGAAEPLLGGCQLRLVHWRALYFEAFHGLPWGTAAEVVIKFRMSLRKSTCWFQMGFFIIKLPFSSHM